MACILHKHQSQYLPWRSPKYSGKQTSIVESPNKGNECMAQLNAIKLHEFLQGTIGGSHISKEA